MSSNHFTQRDYYIPIMQKNYCYGKVTTKHMNCLTCFKAIAEALEDVLNGLLPSLHHDIGYTNIKADIISLKDVLMN